MVYIDPRTVIFLAGVMSGFMAIIVFALKRSYPPAIKGMGDWVIALSLVCVGSILAFGFGTLPDGLSINLPRLLLPLGLFWAYVGTQRFFGVTPRFWRWVVLIGVFALVQVWFTQVNPSYHMRLVFSTVLASCLFLAFINLMRTQGLTSFARVLVAGVMACMLGILAMRLVTSFVWQPGVSILDTAPQHLVYITSFSFFIVLLSVGMVLLATERLHTEVAYLASHDSLTNALTRRHMNEVCARELVRSQRNGQSMALLMMDLDHFKAVNDTYGHQRGDQVLIEFVNKVNSLLRRPDQLARFGGEEFVALLPETSLQEALCVAERIRQACAQPGPDPQCTVSVGVATNLAESDTTDALMARADVALYAAKAKGRNRVEGP